MNTYSQGTIKRRRKGDRWVWCLSITYVDESGAKHNRQKDTDIECSPGTAQGRGVKTKPTGKGSKQALEALAEWRQSLVDAEAKEQGDAERAAREAAMPTVWQIVDGWVQSRADAAEVEASTLSDYRKCAARIRATMPDRPADRLTPADVRRWDAEASQRYAASTYRKTRVVLRAAFEDAHERGVIRSNPVQLRRRNKRERIAAKTDATGRKYNYLDRENRRVLVAELDAMEDEPVTVAARLALFCGLREGECCGLLWGDIDLSEGFVTVRHSIGLGEGGAYGKLPKSDEQREVPMPPELVPVMRRWWTRCAEDAMAVGCDVTKTFVLGNPLVEADPAMFDADDPAPLAGNMNPAVLSRQWGALMRYSKARGALGRRPDFHVLRSTYAYAMANELDMPVEDLARLLGHASTKTTERFYIARDREHDRRVLRRAAEAAWANGSIADAPAEVMEFRATGTEGK